ncbi:ribokinase [Condylostylus longicornis]|uniref:ribokinase n=1 Tax=Condylostylus longicornis TaxID=2530218 RepID=UPI00244E0B07|nr:ribokinase [Condylostylus longicornis]
MHISTTSYIFLFTFTILYFSSYAPRLPKIGETLHGHSFATGFGGKGANQCVACAKLGAKCSLIAKVGNDIWGDKYLENLKNCNVNVEFVEKVKDNTGIAQITVLDSGDNQIIIIPGANKSLSVNDVNRAANHLNKAAVLVCQQETPLDATIEALTKFKGISILNCAPAFENTPNELLTLPTFLCVNESEAALMTNLNIKTLQDAKIAALKLLEIGANSVILTMGKDGAIFSQKNENVYHIPTKKIEKVIDTTGAGDAFIGSLAFFFSKFNHLPITQQIGAACEIASLSVQRTGTQSSFFLISEVKEIIENVENNVYPVHEL